jgi:hypothetical protein
MRLVFGHIWNVSSLLLLATCCTPQGQDPKPPLLETSDGGEDSASLMTTCGKACAKLRELQCPEGSPTLSGARCYDVCQNAGVLVNPECVMSAKSVAMVRRCDVRCER